MMISSVSALAILLSFGCNVVSGGHFIPDATLEFLSPTGLTISLPADDPEVRQVAFHVNINKKFYGLEHGQFAADVTKKRNRKWTWTFPDITVKQGDIINYWINVVEDYMSYNEVDQYYEVTEEYPHGNLPINPATTKKPICTLSKSTVNGGMSVCRGKILLDESFDTMERWSHQVTIGGPLPEDEFMVFTKEPVASWVEDGKLIITPTLLEDTYNDTFVKNGELTLKGCNSMERDHCDKRAHHYLILPPIVSARINTKKNFSFCYGTLELRAKLPRGNWIVPELWLEPVGSPHSERVVIALSRGNTVDSEFGGRYLEAGIYGDSQSSFGSKVQDTPWSEQFHTFKLQWTPDHMEFSVDDQEFHRVSSKGFPIFNKEVYISLGVHVTRRREILDNNSNGAPTTPSGSKIPEWSNYTTHMVESYESMQRYIRFWEDKKSWYPSWSRSSSLQVDHILVTAA